MEWKWSMSMKEPRSKKRVQVERKEKWKIEKVETIYEPVRGNIS